MIGHGEKLSRKQDQAIGALLTEQTIAAAAEHVGIGEATLRRWLKLPEFLAAYREARREGMEKTTASCSSRLGSWNHLGAAARLVIGFGQAQGGHGDPRPGQQQGVHAIKQFLAGREHAPKEVPPPADLSPREVEVLRLLAQGKSNPEIARALFISRNTVQNHVSNILIKTNLNNRAQAAVYAKEHEIA